MKGVYFALFLTPWNPEKISNCHQKQSNGECPLGVLYISLSYAEYQWCISSLKFWHSEVLYTYSAWGFGVARFDDKGNSQEPQGVKRATESGFTSFLF